MGRHVFGGDEPYRAAFSAYPTHCQWCREPMHNGRNAIRYCARCDHLQDMAGTLPGREYEQPKGDV